MKKLFLVALVLVLLFCASEMASRAFESYEIAHFPAAPDDPENFGNYENFLRWVQRLGYLEEYTAGKNQVYLPYTVIANNPGYHVRISNYQIQYNSFGFRSPEFQTPKPRNVFRIFILGGSTVVQGIDNHHVISAYLQQELRSVTPTVEVINAGVQGYSSDNELVQLETQILNLEPDLVIVLDGRNDIYYAAHPDFGPYDQAKKSFDALLNSPRPSSLFFYTLRYIITRSHFLKRLHRFTLKQRNEIVYPRNVAIQEDQVEKYFRNLTSMKAVIEGARVKGILAFQPTFGYCKDNLSPYEKSVRAYFEQAEGTNWFEEVKQAWPAVGKRVLTLPDSAAVKHYDLSCLFAGDRSADYVDSCHYTAAGTQKIAHRLAQIIQENRFLPPQK